MQGIRRIIFVCLLLALLPKLALIRSNQWLFFLLFSSGGTLIIAELLVLFKRLDRTNWTWNQLLLPFVIAAGISFVWMSCLPQKINEFTDATGRYTLVVYQKNKFLTVLGDGGNFEADLRLYNCWGWQIDKSSNKKPIQTENVSVRWRVDGVEYGKSKAPLTFSH